MQSRRRASSCRQIWIEFDGTVGQSTRDQCIVGKIAKHQARRGKRGGIMNTMLRSLARQLNGFSGFLGYVLHPTLALEMLVANSGKGECSRRRAIDRQSLAQPLKSRLLSFSRMPVILGKAA